MPKNNFSDFRQIVLDFPSQFGNTLALAKDFKIQGQFDYILVSGMGASAWPAEILDTLMNIEKKDCILPVNRTYNLPVQIPAKTLTVFSSYSGNTEEPLAVFQEAGEKKLARAAVTSNGQLKKLCQQNNAPLIEIPQGLVPRMATGYLCTALAKIVSAAIPNSINETAFSNILNLTKNLKPADLETQGRSLAKKLKGKIILIYTSDKFKVLGYICKIKLNENTKTPAFCHYIPELNHNELSIYTDSDFQNMQPAVIILKNSDDQPKILKRMDLTVEIIKSTDTPVEIIEMTGDNLLEKMFSTILLSDWLTFYLAQEYDENPLTTDLQEDFKKKMKNK